MKYFFKHIIWFIILFLSFIQARAGDNSVLSQGTWIKIAVMETGMYKIDANQLRAMGLDPNTLDPRNIAIYGNAYNGSLPQANNIPRPIDLLENAISVSGQTDGKFDNSDFITFYGVGAHYLSFDTDTDDFLYQKNIYSDTAFYYLTIKSEAGMRVAKANNETTASEYTTSYKTMAIHELELGQILDPGSGREWVGELFTSGSSTRTLSFSNAYRKTGTDVKMHARVWSKTIGPTTFEFSINDISAGQIKLDAISGVDHTEEAKVNSGTLEIDGGQLTASAELLNVKIKFDGSKGYLDYLNVVTENHLDLDQGFLFFHQKIQDEAFKISKADNTSTVWDISNPVQPLKVNAVRTEASLNFKSNSTNASYVAFSINKLLAPVKFTKISNQNLHALAASEVIYITHKKFLSETKRLADFRTMNDGLLVEVVTVEQIYNEYSSGRQDVVAIRDFIRQQYIEGGKLKYVLMMGDCSYNYKDLGSFGKVNSNYVPIYESRNSVTDTESYASDDFFGFMDSDEGEWLESKSGDHQLDIGIGRIPVNTSEQAKDMVNKIIRYQTSVYNYGNWRNKITFVADDGDSNGHQDAADELAIFVNSSRPDFDIDKIYLDAFEQTKHTANQRSPIVNKKFIDALNNGNLIVNYTGHGNEMLLADEQILTELDIESLTNRQQMPFIVTATCEFGQYDNPFGDGSGGEKLMLHPQGGAIGLLTATRPVYSNTNKEINEAFYHALFQKENGNFMRLGDIIKNTKNNSLAGTKNRNYSLLGDPSMRISFPQNEIKLTSIHPFLLNEASDTLKALGKYVLEGQVQYNGDIDESFNGQITISVFDKPREFKTLGDEKTNVQQFEIQDILIFQGEATVSKGLFNATFVVPKNINYSYGAGKISLYAVNSNKNLDASGYYSQMIVGGSVNNLESDSKSPKLAVFMGDTLFQNGQRISANSILLAHMSDENGLNLSKFGFGNDMFMYFDDEPVVHLGEYYTASIDSYQEGWIAYPMDRLALGEHTLSLVVNDVYLNRTEETIHFNVSEDIAIKISDLSNYPNPMTDQTTFTFAHDREGEELLVDLIIVNFQGQVILKSQYRLVDSPPIVNDIIWDGTDAFGNKLRKGVYIYKFIVRSMVDRAKTEMYRKLVLLN